jgi:hypothetical protein
MSTTRKGRWASRILLAVIFILFSAALVEAGAVDTTWTGNVSSSWFDTGNWDMGGVPGINDVAWIPSVPNLPVVDTGDAFCGGVILASGASITVTNGWGFYVIGDGDLDGDGIQDRYEFNAGFIDPDFDGLPNFDDLDSDNDGMDDGWEQQQGILFDPYLDDTMGNNFHGEPDGTSDGDNDYDGDGFTNLQEYNAGTNPKDPSDYPLPMSASNIPGLLLLSIMVIIFAMIFIRRNHYWARRSLILLFLIGLLLGLGYWRTKGVMGADRFVEQTQKSDTNVVDFDETTSYYHYIPLAVADTSNTVYVNGNSNRPWNGRSTYVNKAIKLEASDGSVYLGGIRTTFDVALHGEGNVIATSSYTGYDYDGIYSSVSIGTGSVSCFLGEWLDLYATPDEKFVEWSGDASGSISNTQFQAAVHGMRVDAIFISPGIDLAGKWTDNGAPVITSSEGVISVSATLYVRSIGQVGTGTAPDYWDDGLFLSRDEVYDSDTDLILAEVSRNEELPPYAEGEWFYTVPLAGTIPDVAPGMYYILGVTDEDNDVSEVNNNNNTVATEIVVLDANLAQ